MKMLFIAPAWQILSVFGFVPSRRPQENSVRGLYLSSFKRGISILLLGLLGIIFIQDLFLWTCSRSTWSELFSHNSRILMLLIHTRSTVVLGKNFASIFLFVCRSRLVLPYIHRFSHLLVVLRVPEKRQKGHKILCVFLFSVPMLVGLIRLSALGVILGTRGDPSDRIPFGASYGISKWILYGLSYSAEVFGDVISWSIALLFVSLGRALKECSVVFNGGLEKVKQELSESLAPVDHTQWMKKLKKQRDAYEQLAGVLNEHEKLFSAQTFISVVGYFLTCFSSLASFFRPAGLSDAGFAIAALGCFGYLFSIVVICMFPIKLHEQSGASTELLQQIAYHHRRVQFDYSKLQPKDDVHIGESRPEPPTSVRDYQELCGFLQRVQTKPLSLTIVGFADLNRSFLVTVAGLIIGFILFLLEQAETSPTFMPTSNSPPLNFTVFA